MIMNTIVGSWITTVVTAWQCRRDEEGGVADDTAMLGLMLAGALLVGGAVLAALTVWGDGFVFTSPNGD